MAVTQSNTRTDSPLGRDVLNAAVYYLRRRWTVAILLGIAIAFGLYFGGWGWLVAAGLAPILISTLPCLVMCGLGVCMMCKSKKGQVAEAAAEGGTAAASGALGSAKANLTEQGSSSCCHGGAKTTEIEQTKDVPTPEKENFHA